MVYKPSMETTRPGKAIMQARQWGVGIFTASIGLGLLLSEIQRVKATIGSPLTIGYLTLFGITGVLIFLWIWATSKELDLCFEWLDPERYAPPSSIKETMMIVAMALVLSLLLFAARDPFYYGLVYTLYSAMLIYGYCYTKSEIRQAIEASKHRLDGERGGDRPGLAAEYQKGVDVLEKYFLLRPQTTRHVIIMTVSALGFIAAIAWKMNRNDVLGTLSYGLLGSTVVISEIIIAKWRLERDRDLRPIEAEIQELTREERTKAS